MVAHEIAAVATLLVVGVILVSSISPNSQAGAVIKASTDGFANLLNAVSAPVRG
jgi:hypothetical protein